MERTLAIIKPDAFAHLESIGNEIDQDGFKILKLEIHQFSEEECKDFYSEHCGKPFFDDLIEYMTSGPCVIMVLQKVRAISEWRSLIGPTSVLEAKKLQPESFRARYGTAAGRNGLHGSDSFLSAEREISFLFPDEFERNFVKEDIIDYIATEIQPKLLLGLQKLCETQPKNPAIWLADWLDKN